MNYSDLMLLRDNTIKNSILRTLEPDERRAFESKLDHAFRDGAQFWSNQQIVTLFGVDSARKILERAVEPE